MMRQETPLYLLPYQQAVLDADSLYSTVLCIIDERIEQLLEDHQGEEMTPFVRALCCDD